MSSFTKEPLDVRFIPVVGNIVVWTSKECPGRGASQQAGMVCPCRPKWNGPYTGHIARGPYESTDNILSLSAGSLDKVLNSKYTLNLGQRRITGYYCIVCTSAYETLKTNSLGGPPIWIRDTKTIYTAPGGSSKPYNNQVGLCRHAGCSRFVRS